MRPLGQRFRVWHTEKTTCFGLCTRAVSQPTHKSSNLCGAYVFGALLFQCLY
ncbi:unnamed protein product, partial [Schistosoma haematobium]